MRKSLYISILVLLIAAAAWLWARSRDSEWTTDSPQALAELQASREAAMKFYFEEAMEHLRRAHELDPDFAMAKLMLARYTNDEELEERLLEELRSLDLDDVTPTEAFLIRQELLRQEGERDRANEELAGYLERHPDDPFALSMAADVAWTDQDFERARNLYRRLLEVDPNWVEAQNRLGYVAMAQGRFQDAEELFDTYAFVAPDQPNPHDSKAELLTLVGRYEEARAELEEALAVRPGFCASHRHLLFVDLLEGRLDEAENTVARAAAHCPEGFQRRLRCELAAWEAAVERRPAEVWEAIPAECKPEATGTEQLSELSELALRAALAAGERQVFDAAIRELRGYLESDHKAGRKNDRLKGIVLHLEGLRAAADGDLKLARQRLRTADGRLVYWGEGIGLLKLLNLTDLARVERRLGDERAAEAALARVEEVNPHFEIGPAAIPICAWP